MRKRLNPDSAVFRILELLTNLVLLNLLFIICSLPLVTAGAAACALYDAMFRYLKKEDSTVLKPFFRAFCNNFRQGTIVGIPLILAIALLIFDWMFLLVNAKGVLILLWLPTIFGLLFVAAVQTYYFALAARYRMTISQMLRTSISCFVLHPIRSVIMYGLQCLPLILFLTFPYMFYCGGIFWVSIWFSLVALINTAQLIKIFSQYSEEEAAL